MADEATGEEIKVTIRQSSGTQFDVTVKADISITELKKACEEGC